jgi:hypothetical protein
MLKSVYSHTEKKKKAATAARFRLSPFLASLYIWTTGLFTSLER